MQLPQFQAHSEMEQNHWWFLGRQHILATLLRELLPPSKSTHLIDIGCGTGGLTQYFSGEYSVMGIDPSEDAICFAKQKFPACTFIRGNAPEDVRDELSRADGVLLIEVLEHVEHDAEFVRSLLESMKSGAYLFIMAPADMSLWSPHDAAFEHYRRYDSVGEFRKLWDGPNVREVLVSYCNARLYPVVKLMRKLSKLRGKSWGKGGTDIEVPMKPVNVMLRNIFSGEAAHLKRVLHGTGKPYSSGVTLMAVLKKI